MLLADRIIVLGRNPAKIRADFRVPLQHPRDRKSAAFVLYVDYIYKVMTQPQLELAPPSKTEHKEKAAAQMLPHSRPGGIGACWSCWTIAAAKKTCTTSPRNCCWKWTTCCRFWMQRRCSASRQLHEGDVRITPRRAALSLEADIPTRKEIVSRSGAGARFAPAADSVRAAEEIKSHHAGGIFPRLARRTFRASGSRAADRDRAELGPLRRALHLRSRRTTPSTCTRQNITAKIPRTALPCTDAQRNAESFHPHPDRGERFRPTCLPSSVTCRFCWRRWRFSTQCSP